MIGRAARGNPWIFREIPYYLENGISLSRPNTNELVDMMIRHANLLKDCKGEYTATREMRKHVGWYTAGLPNSAATRRKVNEITSFGNLLDFLEESRYTFMSL